MAKTLIRQARYLGISPETGMESDSQVRTGVMTFGPDQWPGYYLSGADAIKIGELIQRLQSCYNNGKAIDTEDLADLWEFAVQILSCDVRRLLAERIWE